MLNKILGAFWQNTKNQDDKRIATLTPPEGVYESDNHEYLPDGHIYHKLDVYYPEGTTDKLPVIIDIHGGGWMYGDKELNKIYCLTLAKKGYVVFNMSYRLYPEVIVKDQLWDISQALKWIKAHLSDFPCDENNICLTGDSAGGMLSFFTAMLSSSSELRNIYELEDAGIRFNAVGLTSPMLFMDDGTVMSLYTRIMLGKNYKNEKWGAYVNMDRLLPLGKVPPVFLLTSSGDILARSQTRKGAELLKEKGIDFQLMDFEKHEGTDLPHVFPVLHPESEVSGRAIDEMLNFFSEHSKKEINL
ncbi:MAG: alpha/beta hydrolase [Clostridia bacterium]|nr:alpha/beta hydrolase [Clostridia bacterium]